MPDAYENINMAIATGNIVANNNDSYLTFNGNNYYERSCAIMRRARFFRVWASDGTSYVFIYVWLRYYASFTFA